MSNDSWDAHEKIERLNKNYCNLHDKYQKLLVFVKEISTHLDECVSPGIQREAKRLLKEIGEVK